MPDNSRTQPSENRSLARQTDALHPVPAFRRDMERLFEDFFSVFGLPVRADGQQGAMQRTIMVPRMDVSESENEIRITAELPGIDEKDIDIRLVDDVLTVSGETKAEHEEKRQDYHLMERARGAFARSLRLPFPVDASQVQASFKDGVLTITVPKPQEVRDKVQRIEVRRDQASPGGQQGAGSQSAAEQRTPETAAE
jgi:HSP20 family protein